jgi:hypothetical protein
MKRIVPDLVVFISIYIFFEIWIIELIISGEEKYEGDSYEHLTNGDAV